MDKKKMTKKGTHIVKRLLAAVCTAALVLGLVPGNLGISSVQAYDEIDKTESDCILDFEDKTTNITTNIDMYYEKSTDPEEPYEGYVCVSGKNYTITFTAKSGTFNENDITINDPIFDHLTIVSKTLSNDKKTYTFVVKFAGDSSIEISGAPTGTEAPTKTATTTTLSAESITVNYGETWTLTAQAKADGADIDGATVVYYSDEDLKTKLSNDPTAVGTYYARGEYYGSDSYEASNSEIITVTIKEKTRDYDYTMAELKEKGTTRLPAGTKIYLDSEIYAQGQVGGSYEYGIAKGYITYDSSKVQNYETYKLDRGYLVGNQGYYTDREKGKIITLTNSYTYQSSPNKTITGEEWYVRVEVVPFGGKPYSICIMPTSPTEGYIKEDTHTHTPVHHDEVAATTTSTGKKEYWSCSGCDKIFLDAACTQETTLEALTIPALENSVTINSGKLIVSAATTVPAIKTATVAATASDVNKMLTDSNNLTADEITAIEGGATAKIVLNVTDSTNNISSDSKEAIDDKVEDLAKTVSGLKVGQYLDIKLKKYIDNEEKADITDLKGNTVTVSMTLSGDLVNTDSTKTRTYYIIRLHDGQADKLDAIFDASTNTLSFKTGLFSDYAIAYAETPKSADSGNNGSNGSAAATSTASTSTTTTAATDTTAVADGTTDAANTVSSPKTGEETSMTWLAVILFAGAACIVALKAYRKREI